MLQVCCLTTVKKSSELSSLPQSVIEPLQAIPLCNCTGIHLEHPFRARLTHTRLHIDDRRKMMGSFLFLILINTTLQHLPR
jgi:hypothetical protein